MAVPLAIDSMEPFFKSPCDGPFFHKMQFATSCANPFAPRLICPSIHNPAPTPVEMVRNSTIFFPFPAPITVSASPARFASFSNCTEIPVIFSNSFVSSKLCHPGRFGGVKIIPLIKSNGPGQEIPIPSIFSPNPLITSLIWFNVFIGFFGSDPN